MSFKTHAHAKPWAWHPPRVAMMIDMKRLVWWAVVFGAIGLTAWAAPGPGMSYWRERYRVAYREGEVTRGPVVAVVNSTGTVNPVQSVKVGSFVSGPIAEIGVDFNSEIKKGDV